MLRRHRRSAFFPALAIGLGLVPSLALSEDLPTLNFSTVASGSLSELHDLFETSRGGGPVALKQVSNLRVQADLPGAGSATLEFNGIRAQDWPATLSDGSSVISDASHVVLLRGQLISATDKTPIAGSLLEQGGVPTLKVFFRDLDEETNPNAYVIDIPLSGPPMAAVSSVPVSALEHAKCGSEGMTSLAAIGGVPHVGHVSAQATEVKVMSLGTDADFEWFQRYGSSSNSQIASLINAVNVLYERDLGLQIDIAGQNVWSSSSQPYTTRDAEQLLEQFQDYSLTNQQMGSADLFHLFTGKSMLDGVAGIAYLGVVCSAPSYSFGVTERLSEQLDYIVLAHEIGHNLDAEHDTSSPRSIMYPSVGSTQTFFSNGSKTQIANYVNSNGSCLSNGTADPSPDPREGDPEVELEKSFNKRSGRLSVELQVTNAQSTSCSIVLEMSRSSDMSSPSRKTLYRGTGTRVVAEATLPKKVYATRTTSSDVYLRGSYECSGSAAVVSSTTRIRHTKSSSSRDYPSVRRWISRAVSKLTRVS